MKSNFEKMDLFWNENLFFFLLKRGFRGLPNKCIFVIQKCVSCKRYKKGRVPRVPWTKGEVENVEITGKNYGTYLGTIRNE